MDRHGLAAAWCFAAGALVAAGWMGCGSDVTETVATTSGTPSTTTGTGGHTTTSSSTESGGSGGAPLATITFSGTAVRSPQGAPISGLSACVFDHAEMPCATTDSSGGFSLALPASAETGISLTKAGYGGVLVPLVTSDQDQQGWIIGVPPEATILGYYQAAGAPYPDTGKGFLAVFTTLGNTQQGKDGVSISLAPASGVGPFYADPNNAPDLALQATSTAGYARFGSISLGEVEVSLLPDTLSCDPNFGGWPSPNANAVRVPVAEGLETHVGFGCL